ncbi:MAG: sigma-54-dependent Fis family transcriptional regulator [Nitrospirae bacterium]|nr:sigma-54-dependent Fis family transcriptional regulator [Nitrospirota bacterium]
MGRILVVDDEKSMRDFLSILLAKEGHSAETAENGVKAVKMLKEDIFDVVITDVKMPRMGGMEVLRAVNEYSPDTMVIMITAYATAETAVEAMKDGAYDYIMKPFKVDEIKLVVRNAVEKRRLREENALLRREVEAGKGMENFIGRSDAMRKVFGLISKVADKNSTVLITGESGTGKELAARALHNLGARKDKPFVYIHCGALPEQLLESELFGHMKGSFTGAVENKEGLFEVAEGGTVFLDEISETTQAFQVKLLHVLQEREFRRVGGTSDIRVDVRVVAATNKDLAGEIKAGNFREDLFYRLNVIPLRMPALRERADDIPLLVEHFLAKCGKAGGRVRVSKDALERLASYHWKGNVRELENVIERACALTDDGDITADCLPAELGRGGLCEGAGPVRLPAEGIDLDAVLDRMEKEYLIQALDISGGSKTEAARLLSLTFPSFRHKLKKHGIDR